MSTASDEFDRKSLEKELLEINIKDINSFNIEYLDYSPADKTKNKEVYKNANTRLLEIIEEKEVGEYIHITGEMRALTDSDHRKCIKELYNHDKQQFKIIFSLPEEFGMNASDIKKYNKKTWDDSNWIDHLVSFDILGANKVRLYNNYNRESIQYSLFGTDLILFQSRHKIGDHIKKVWLLQSKSLFKSLQNHAKEVLKSSDFIEPYIFFQFNLSLSSNISLHLLYSLQNKGIIKKEVITQELKKFRIHDKSLIKNLESIGFIQIIDNSYQLTSDGNSFLELFG